MDTWLLFVPVPSGLFWQQQGQGWALSRQHGVYETSLLPASLGLCRHLPWVAGSGLGGLVRSPAWVLSLSRFSCCGRVQGNSYHTSDSWGSSLLQRAPSPGLLGLNPGTGCLRPCCTWRKEAHRVYSYFSICIPLAGWCPAHLQGASRQKLLPL